MIPMKAATLGEFGLIAHLAGVIAEEGRGGRPSPDVAAGRLLAGIGDDAAVWQIGDAVEVATTDTMVAGVHFLPEQADWRALGWKALAVNLSDIAAMGAVPGFALITLGLPPDSDVDALTELYRGLGQAARTFGARLVGGDIVRSPVLFVTVALTGTAPGARFPEGVLLRSAAQPGDLIAVTGHLGSSAAGLQTLLSDLALPLEVGAVLRQAHLRPSPRLDEGRLLVEAGVRCAMDVSDGLLADLSKLCAASEVAGVVEQELVPVLAVVREHFPDTWRQLALTGGEDYELLFAAPAAVVGRVRAQAAVPVTVLGRIEAGTAGRVTLVDGAGQELPWQGGGWDHLTGATS